MASNMAMDIGFIGLGTESGESGHGSNGEETSGLVHDGFLVKSVSEKPVQKPFLNRVR